MGWHRIPPGQFASLPHVAAQYDVIPSDDPSTHPAPASQSFAVKHRSPDAPTPLVVEPVESMSFGVQKGEEKKNATTATQRHRARKRMARNAEFT